MKYRRASSSEGAATRTRRHRLLMGAMSLLVLLAQRMMRMFDMYFSMVRRSAAWASRVSESASLMMTTGGHMSEMNYVMQVNVVRAPLNRCLALISSC